MIFGKFGFVGSNHLALEHMPLVYVLPPGDCSGVSATDLFDFLMKYIFFLFLGLVQKLLIGTVFPFPVYCTAIVVS